MLDETKAALGQQSLLASTNGWDTVYGIRFSKVNQAIAAEGASPEDFDYTEAGGGEENVITGTFSDWTLTSGSGSLLTMTVPIPTFTYTPDSETPITRTGAVATIEVQLEAIPQPVAAHAVVEDGVKYDLKLKTNRGENDLASQTVDVKTLTYPGDGDDGDIPTEVRLLLQQWMRTGENLQRFNHTFATVKLNAKAAVDAFDWLMPTFVGYGAIAESGTDEGVFAVLCMTENRNPPIDETLSTDLVPVGKEAAFLISKERFLRKMILPGMMWMFSEPTDRPELTWPEDFFDITDDQLKNKFTLTINSFEIGKDTVEATLPPGKLVLTLEQNYLSYEISEMKHSYWGAWYDVTHRITSRLLADVNEQQQFFLIPGTNDDNTDIIDHTAELEKTPLAKTIDVGILIADVVLLAFAIGKLGYARYAARGATVTSSSVSTGATVSRSSTETIRSSVSSVSSGASAASAASRSSGGAVAKTFLERNSAMLQGAAICAMNTALAVDQIYERMANANNWGTNAIPDIKDFVTSILEPVQWPEQAEFEVESVRFNGGLHIVGRQEIADVS